MVNLEQFKVRFDELHANAIKKIPSTHSLYTSIFIYDKDGANKQPVRLMVVKDFGLTYVLYNKEPLKDMYVKNSALKAVSKKIALKIKYVKVDKTKYRISIDGISHYVNEKGDIPSGGNIFKNYFLKPQGCLTRGLFAPIFEI